MDKNNQYNSVFISDVHLGFLGCKAEKLYEFLNKLTHFDLRLKKFPIFSMAQTLIAKIDCSIYHLKDRYIVTCNRSFEDYFKERLKDTADIN